LLAAHAKLDTRVVQQALGMDGLATLWALTHAEHTSGHPIPSLGYPLLPGSGLLQLKIIQRVCPVFFVKLR
jgi:hypothetical protein